MKQLSLLILLVKSCLPLRVSITDTHFKRLCSRFLIPSMWNSSLLHNSSTSYLSFWLFSFSRQVDWAGLELTEILLSLFPKNWGQRHAPLYPTSSYLFFFFKIYFFILCMSTLSLSSDTSLQSPTNFFNHMPSMEKLMGQKRLIMKGDMK